MHDGGWEGFQSALLLVPDAGLGLFVQLLLVLPLLVLALTVAAIAATVRAWRRVSVPARVHQAVVLAGLLALLWFCRHWNLLGRHL